MFGEYLSCCCVYPFNTVIYMAQSYVYRMSNRNIVPSFTSQCTHQIIVSNIIEALGRGILNKISLPNGIFVKIVPLRDCSQTNVYDYKTILQILMQI